jgi:drug/metabolite transporter (DMT)-like permease
MEFNWLALTLGATVLWGLGTLAAKPSTDRIGPRRMALGATLVEGVVFALVGFFLPRGPLPANALLILAAVAAGAWGSFGYIFFYEGMRLGSVGLVGTVSAAYPILTVALSVLILREPLGAFQALGIGFTILCVLLLAYDPRRSDAARRTAVVLSLLGFFAWGLWGFLVKASVGALGQGNLDLFLASAYLGVTAANAMIPRRSAQRTDSPTNRAWNLALFVFFAGAVGAVGLAIAYELGPADLVSPVSGTYPIISTLGAAVVLKEKLNWRIAVALVAFGLGIALLSIA